MASLEVDLNAATSNVAIKDAELEVKETLLQDPKQGETPRLKTQSN